MAVRKTTTSEHTHQCNLIEWCERFKHRIPELDLIFAIPNGGKRSIGVAVKMKREGVKKGVPDLCLPIPRHGFNGFFIELKIKGNSTTSDQVEWFDRLQRQGYRCSVYYHWTEAAAAILSYLDLSHLIRELIGEVETHAATSKPTRRKTVQRVRQAARTSSLCDRCKAEQWRRQKGIRERGACNCGKDYAAHSLGEAARLMHVSRGRVQQFINSGQYGTMINGQWHFTQVEIERPRIVGRPRKERT